MSSLDQLPENLPVPEDDGACSHLHNFALPSIQLLSTNGQEIDFSTFKSVVIYCYPMTGRPDVQLPEEWEQIPGARGCTPQSCSFRDHYSELKALGTEVYGLSTQNTEYQQEVKNRLHLPFELVSDYSLKFINALNLPTFDVEGMQLSKRVTLVAQNGLITKVFYPVFPPDKNADQVIEFLRGKNTYEITDLWLIASTITLVIGMGLIFHSSGFILYANYDALTDINNAFYTFEVLILCILLAPTVLLFYASSLYFDKETLELMVGVFFIFHYISYGILFYILTRIGFWRKVRSEQ